jgi:hypothetical protein
MEQRLVPIIEKFGFKVTPNERYHETTSAEAVEVEERRVRSHRALFRENVLRLAKELTKQNLETKILRLCAANRGAKGSDGN